MWAFLGAELPNIGLNAVAGRPKEEYAMDPQSFDDMRPGAYDIDLRIKEMDANGLLGSMCFPSFPQFTGQLFARTALQDADLALALVQAYNDWHIDGWCGKYPGRFIPLAIPPLWDPQLIAAELERVAEKGCHAMTFSENVSSSGTRASTPTTGTRCSRRPRRSARCCAVTSGRRRRSCSPRPTRRWTC